MPKFGAHWHINGESGQDPTQARAGHATSLQAILPLIRLPSSGLIYFIYHCHLMIDKSYRPFLMVWNRC